MEGETETTIAQQYKLWHNRILPTLDNNIKSGNSLVGIDIYESIIDFGEDKKIKPFNWQKAFPDVFKREVSEQEEYLKQIARKAKEHAKKAMEYASELEEKLTVSDLKGSYRSKFNGGFDVIIGNPPYLKLTTNNTDNELISYYQKKFYSYSGGSSKNLYQLFLEQITNLKPQIFSFIIPEALLTTNSNGKIREILLQNFNINSIVTFDHFVFEDATIGTTIIVGEKNSKDKTKIVIINKTKQQILVQETILNNGLEPWDVSLDDSSKKLFNKILESSKLMGELVEMSKGMVVKNRNNVLTETPTKKSLPFLLGNCMKRYNYQNERYAEYEKLEIIGGTRGLSKHITIPRLLIRRTGSNLCVTYSDKPELIESTIYFLRSDKISLKFLLGLLNSKLLSFYLTKRLVTNTQGFPQVLMGQLEQLPIVITDEKNQVEIIKLVDQLLKLYKEVQELKLDSKREQIQVKIDYCENRINESIYKLYGLEKSEIDIIEESAKR